MPVFTPWQRLYFATKLLSEYAALYEAVNNQNEISGGTKILYNWPDQSPLAQPLLISALNAVGLFVSQLSIQFNFIAINTMCRHMICTRKDGCSVDKTGRGRGVNHKGTYMAYNEHIDIGSVQVICDRQLCKWHCIHGSSAKELWLLLLLLYVAESSSPVIGTHNGRHSVFIVT